MRSVHRLMVGRRRHSSQAKVRSVPLLIVPTPLGSGGPVKVGVTVVTGLLLALAGAATGHDWLGGFLHILSRWLLDLPEPTDTWAGIVKAWAWPLALFYFLSRYRGHVRTVLDTVADRVRTDKTVKLGPFELSAGADVISLKPEEASESTEPLTIEDMLRIDRILEFIAEPANRDILAAWMRQNVGPSVTIDSFLTESTYVTQREQSVQALIGGG